MFDAAGQTNCSGVPKTCQPLWSTPIGYVGFAALSVAYGKVYVADSLDGVKVFDSAGASCSGTPMTCTPLFTFGAGAAVTIANGLAIQRTPTGIYAYDAHGVTNCNAGHCTPVAQVGGGGGGGTISNGFITSDGKVFAVTVGPTGDAELIGVW